MKCQDAIDSLRAAQDEFALRYYRWCLRESARELAAGFPRVRQFPSSQSLAFLDFVDTLTADEARAAMAGNLKFHHAASADLAGDVATTEELATRQRWLAFLRPEIVRQGERCTTLYVSPREQSIMQRDLDGRTRLWEKTDRKTFIAVLREELDPVLGPPERSHATALEYCVPVGRWYLHAQVDLGGRSQLACSQHVEARRARDLCRCVLSGGHGINLLGWCGVHPSTHTNLIAASQLEVIATLVREVFAFVLQEAPAWLSGLDHAVPETIDDANTWLEARLPTGSQRKQ
jgi:hypothetical protein